MNRRRTAQASGTVQVTVVPSSGRLHHARPTEPLGTLTHAPQPALPYAGRKPFAVVRHDEAQHVAGA